MKRLAATFHCMPLATAAVMAVAAPFGLFIGQNAPDAASPVVVISAPWDSAARVAAAASANLIQLGRVRSIGLVYANTPEFAADLRDAGAWLVLNGRLSGALCQSI